ncbi:alpha/beta fold hydrolase [Alteromonas halophila]|uniref:Alpha/beta hydrolase n=1 Tax=Alteromonas halophila TaxID=516698 RepID=A0A918JF87_9ALTE|nr:alpha/beta fold hydrolase [Alteromonas halophila]GGW78052.1 alpha/beta hydrolase [Alteromonas halophila]
MVAALIILVTAIFCVGFLYTRFVDRQLIRSYPARGQLTPVAGGAIHWSCVQPDTTENAKPPLILIHGLAGNLHNFAALEKRLSATYTVYCVDRPGSGHAQRLFDTDSSFEEQSRMLVEWMDKENIPPAIIVGHSMGGGIALNMALQFPHYVAGLALLCPLAAPLNIRVSGFTRWALKRAWVRLFAAKFLLSTFRKRYSQQQVSAIFAPELPHTGFASDYGGALSMHSASFFAASSDLASAQRSLYSQYQHYHAITCPVGVIYGDGDRILSHRLHMGHMQKLLPEAHYVLLEGKGHMLPITAVDECTSLIARVSDEAAQKA